MNTLRSAAATANALAWMLYEQQQQEAEAIEQMEVDKYEEILGDAELMDEAMTHLYLSSEENRQLVMNTRHAITKATRGKSIEAIQEAAVGLSDLQDKAASMYAEHLVNAASRH